jgi:hypothetical protein
VTTTDYFDDGTVVVKREIADNNFESMPDITTMMKHFLPAPKKEDEIKMGGFVDPNLIRSEEEVRKNRGKYFEFQLQGMGVDKLVKNPVQMPEPQILTYRPEPVLKAGAGNK